MREFASRREGAFTLIELMIVVLIVAILALIAIPIFTANSASAIMSEGVTGAGMVRNQMRVYLSNNTSYTGASYTSGSVNSISVGPTDLCGKYFKDTDYTLAVTSSSQYTITCHPTNTTRTGLPTYQINQDGSETSGAGFYSTGN